MRVSLRWLREYVHLVVPPEELARRLTMAGVEVTAIDRVGASWEHVWVAQVTGLSPHSNADRLQLVAVEYGAGRTNTVVTGAFNLRVGDLVPFATVGARLIDTHSAEPREVILKPARLRGVVSEGMVCSEELGLGDDHSGIMILSPEAKVGAPLADELGDAILDIDVTPNMVYCMSMLGVAQEVAALTGQRVRPPDSSYVPAGPPAEDLVRVEIADQSLCRRYTAAVISGVRIGRSPGWLEARLLAAGLRPINNVVDVTNYVMLECNQPLHAFDYDKIRGRRIDVRRAATGERLRTLDGVDRELTTEILVIADAASAVAIAGVMGGADTEVTPETTNVLLESASFDQMSVRRTARTLRLPSEASRRFERGQPPENTEPAARRAAQLIQQTAGGDIAPGLADSYPAPALPRHIALDPAEVLRILGFDLSAEEVERILGSLGYSVERRERDLLVTVPPARVDVAIPADLLEDLARIIGYEQLPSTMPDGPLPEGAPISALAQEARVRQVLIGCGFAETIHYPLTSRERLGRLRPPARQSLAPSADALHTLSEAVSERLAPVGIEPIAIGNPLSADLECLRTTAFADLLEALTTNLRHAERDVRLFEIGRIYLPQDGVLPEERPVLTAVMGAYQSGLAWGSREETDFFDAKGVAEAIFDRLGLDEVHYRPVDHPIFHPAKAAALVLGPVGEDSRPESGRVVGVVGEVAAEVRRAFDLDQRAFLLALDLGRLLAAAASEERYKPLPRFPAVVQDVAFVVDAGVSAEAVEAVIRRAGRPLARTVELFDVYQGGTIPDGRRSLAYHVVYQAADRTLTDAEVADIHHKIEEALARELGAEPRG